MLNLTPIPQTNHFGYDSRKSNDFIIRMARTATDQCLAPKNKTKNEPRSLFELPQKEFLEDADRFEKKWRPVSKHLAISPKTA